MYVSGRAPMLMLARRTGCTKTNFRSRRARAAHKPVIAIFADHLLVPSKTDCSTAIMWPACAFSSTPKTDLNSDETFFHMSCVSDRDLVLSASLASSTHRCSEIIFWNSFPVARYLRCETTFITRHPQRNIISVTKYFLGNVAIQKKEKEKRMTRQAKFKSTCVFSHSFAIS